MSALPQTPRTQIAMHRLGLIQEDLQVIPLQHLKTYYADDIANVHYQARQEFVSDMKKQLIEERNHVNKNISVLEFLWAGEPEQLISRVTGGKLFVEKFKLQEKEDMIKTLDDRRDFVNQQESTYLNENKSKFNTREKRFQSNYNDIISQKIDKLNESRRSRDEHFKTTLSEAEVRKVQALFDPNITITKQKTAYENRQMLFKDRLEKQREQIQQINDHIQQSKNLRQDEEQQFINNQSLNWKKIQSASENAIQYKNERFNETVKRLEEKQRNYDRLLQENTIKVQQELSEKTQRVLTKLEQENKLLEELVKQKQEEVLNKKQELERSISVKKEFHQQILSDVEKMRQEKFKQQISREQKVIEEKQEIERQIRQNLVKELVRKEKLKNQMRQMKRREDYQNELKSMELVINKNKFGKLERIATK
ncbi:hypothetical protein SS50377_27039 [Spironucleus salmonicida]|uniref:Uncharacterized protein n=1 Tax=Spironucleus salmonicida TaxID=348837 RepID=V6M2R0_9EUKA|nr:hypothetical protein SS50377_27039 [Spironucleus salmonicida]|eukprot:EST47549.1 Hypothetical protein SS50377_12532 [Spironucleus salmonicida]